MDQPWVPAASRPPCGRSWMLTLRAFLGAVVSADWTEEQQLAVTAWNIAFAVALVVWAFGWAGGRELVETSYGDAKVKVAEHKAQRAAAHAAKRRTRER